MIKVFISGHLGKDAEVKQIGDKSVIKFSIASAFNKKTTWINCDYWNSSKIYEYLKKGYYVVISGRLEQQEYDGKQYYNCVVDTLDLVPKMSCDQKNDDNNKQGDLPF